MKSPSKKAQLSFWDMWKSQKIDDNSYIKRTWIELLDDKFDLAGHFSIAFFAEAAKDVLHSLEALARVRMIVSVLWGGNYCAMGWFHLIKKTPFFGGERIFTIKISLLNTKFLLFLQFKVKLVFSWLIVLIIIHLAKKKPKHPTKLLQNVTTKVFL